MADDMKALPAVYQAIAAVMEDVGREVRMEVAAILAKYNGKHEAIAGVKVETIRKIDLLLNPEPEGFEVNTRNDRPYHTELALKNAGRVRAIDQSSGFNETLATIENHRAAGLRETAGAAEGVGA